LPILYEVGPISPDDEFDVEDEEEDGFYRLEHTKDYPHHINDILSWQKLTQVTVIHHTNSILHRSLICKEHKEINDADHIETSILQPIDSFLGYKNHIVVQLTNILDSCFDILISTNQCLKIYKTM
jgi:hypothetical protein